MDFLKKYFIVFCTVALLFPSIVSLAHISAHQGEKPCTNLADTHYHKKSLECELCDFRLTNFYTFNAGTYTLLEPTEPVLRFFDLYQFLSDYQKLPFELRGPPARV